MASTNLTLKLYKNVLTPEDCSIILDFANSVPKENVVNIKNEHGEIPYEQWYGINIVPNRFRFNKDKFKFLSESINKNTPYTYDDWANDNLYVNSYYVGDECLRHVDLITKGRKEAVAKGGDIFTSILLLNNDFEGGILKAGNRDMPVDLDVGDMVVFNGKSTSHLVTEITRGERHTLTIWGKYV